MIVILHNNELKMARILELKFELGVVRFYESYSQDILAEEASKRERENNDFLCRYLKELSSRIESNSSSDF